MLCIGHWCVQCAICSWCSPSDIHLPIITLVNDILVYTYRPPDPFISHLSVFMSNATAYVASGKWHCILWVNSNDAITEEDGNANGIIYEGPDDKWIHEVFEMSKNPVNEATVTEKTQRKIKQFLRNNHNVVPLSRSHFPSSTTLSLYLSTITSYLKLQLVSLSDV